MNNKAELVEVILAGQGGEAEIERTAKQLTPMLSMMIQMADGKAEDIPVFSRRLAERMVPVIKDVARETYMEHYSMDQLVALAEFHRNNPWYHEKSAMMSEVMNAVASERAGPMMKELFDEYLPSD